MSVLDELSGLQDRVRSRMQELRPLLDEYAELEKAAQQLGISVENQPPPSAAKAQRQGIGGKASGDRKQAALKSSSASAAPAPGSRSGRTRAKSSPRQSRAAGEARTPRTRSGGKRAEELAALVAQRPGLTVKEAGTAFGVEPTSLYRVVKQLETAGTVQKRGRELYPA